MGRDVYLFPLFLRVQTCNIHPQAILIMPKFPAAIRSAPLWGPDYHPGISLFNLSPFISCSCFFMIPPSLPVNYTLIHSSIILFIFFLASFIFNFILLFFLAISLPCYTSCFPFLLASFLIILFLFPLFAQILSVLNLFHLLLYMNFISSCSMPVFPLILR